MCGGERGCWSLYYCRFGFVTFESVDAVARAMSATEDQLILDGR